MNNIIAKTCLKQTTVYEVLGDLKVQITIERNPFSIPPNLLFDMAARKNPKRSFLFVSKVLGKHIPVHPLIPFIGGAALAQLYLARMYQIKTEISQEDFIQAFLHPEEERGKWEAYFQKRVPLPEGTLVIGFAETATALGQAVFNCFSGPIRYLHTTRERIVEQSQELQFAEEHSHAPEHRCLPQDKLFFTNKELVVLVDDELTTGKSALNFIEAIQMKHQRQCYVLLTLLDWRSEADCQRFRELEEKLGIEIKVISLVSGQIKVTGKAIINESKQEAAATSRIFPESVQKVVMPRPFTGPILSQPMQGEGKPRQWKYYLVGTGRFGLSAQEHCLCEEKWRSAGAWLKKQRRGKRTLCLGTGEFMYVPFVLAKQMGIGVWVQSTTRSPIYSAKKSYYAVQDSLTFSSPSNSNTREFVYNLGSSHYDEVFVFLEQKVDQEPLNSFLSALGLLAIPRIVVVSCIGLIPELQLPEPVALGSYKSSDVTFLLKDLSSLSLEMDTEEREKAIQQGCLYSEMLPNEYQPRAEYLALFHKTLQQTAHKVALAVAKVAETLIKLKGQELILVSLARAGTPVGILLKRYLRLHYHFDVPHYSISIIRGHGIDENALNYILARHPKAVLQFVDGWTGKGAILQELSLACEKFFDHYGVKIEPDLAVLADPGCCVRLYGTREDFLIPSACLNSTVSGLVSRTVYRADLIGPTDFHGVKYYRQWRDQDVSNLFIDTIAACFDDVEQEAKKLAYNMIENLEAPTWQGLRKVEEIQKEYSITNFHLIKPGVGETTRVLLRRVPWRILVDSVHNPNLQHVLMLARERGVPVEEKRDLGYSCCGLIQKREQL